MLARKPAPLRRREIADAALKVIAERGLARFTSVAIAREVGVSDAALFRHFPTKAAIVLAAIERVGEILFEEFPPQDSDPIDRLGRFFRQRIAVIRESPGVARLVGSEQLEQAAPAEGIARVVEFRRRSQGFVRETLEEAYRRRMLADGLAPAEATVLVLGSLLALAHGREAPAAAGALPGRVWQALERALRSPQAPRPGPGSRSSRSSRLPPGGRLGSTMVRTRPVAVAPGAPNPSPSKGGRTRDGLPRRAR
ncbi:MAG TPA: TetR/AcrR family transcriptional regulator [Anaeromyxobacteraceae bacterium]|nr:TetR/AcrR family transcriptional regulator [Anaeromyxobacteraceae bacterium]